MKKTFAAILCSISTLGALASPLRAPGEVNLIGNFYDSPDPELKGRMVRIPVTANADFEVVGGLADYPVDASWGGYMDPNGKYYAASQWQLSATMAYTAVQVCDPATWLFTRSICSDNTRSILASAITYDATDKKVYGAYASFTDSGSKYEFGTGDYTAANPVHTAIADISGAWSALAADADGTLYVITSKGEFGTVDKTTGKPTLTGTTGGVTSQALSSAIIDPATGRFFWAVNNDSGSGLYEINKTTGKATLLRAFPNGSDHVAGLYIGTPLAAAKAPDRVSDFSVLFTDGSLDGKVSFTAPAANFDGSAGSGMLDYTIMANTSVAKTGKVAYGGKVSDDVSLSLAGEYTVSVSVSNSEGTSPAVKTSIFIGNDTPKAPAGLALDYTSDKMNLSWQPVTESVYGRGFFIPAEITYTVTRYPDGVVVSKGQSATTFSETISEPEVRKDYYYTVRAVFRTESSEASDSPHIALGSLSAPWKTDFSDGTLGDLSVIDANGDGATFNSAFDSAIYNNYLQLNGAPMDEWLITPALKLLGGEAYVFSVDEHWVPVFGITCTPDLEIYMGDAPDAASMTHCLLERVAASNTKTMTHSFVITPETTGTVYFGVHGVSDSGNMLYIPRMSLTSAAIPAAVENFEIIPGASGAKEATVRFNAPTKDLAGRPLKSLTKIEVYRAETQLIATFENPEPGKLCEILDKVEYGMGDYLWTVRVYNEIGEGTVSNKIAHLGVPMLYEQGPVAATEEGHTGKVTLSWTPIFKDAYGRDVDPSLVKLDIMSYGSYIEKGLDATLTSYTFQAVEEGTQGFMLGAVNYVTESGSRTAVGELMAVGKPYGTYIESFRPEPEHPFETTDVTAYARWTLAADGDIEGVNSVDGDGGFIYLESDQLGSAASLYLGKFDLAGMDKPAFSVNVLRTQATDNNNLQVLVDDGSGFKMISACEVGKLDGKDLSWVKTVADLSAYKGKVVHIKVLGTRNGYNAIFLDLAKVYDNVDHNLAVTALSVPEEATPGFEYRLSTTIENMGAKASGAFEVRVYCNGEIAASVPEEGLEPDGVLTLTFADTPTLLSEPELEYYVEVVYAADQLTDDNTSERRTMRVRLPDYPAVDDLRATCDDGANVVLTWSEPSLGSATDLALKGFNVWRDGEIINEAPVEDCTFTDSSALAGTHVYAVTTIYDKGQSRGSNKASVQVTVSLRGHRAGTIAVESGAGTITVSGAGGQTLTVHTAAGTLVYASTAQEHECVRVATGVYIVRVGTSVFKIAVR